MDYEKQKENIHEEKLEPVKEGAEIICGVVWFYLVLFLFLMLSTSFCEPNSFISTGLSTPQNKTSHGFHQLQKYYKISLISEKMCSSNSSPILPALTCLGK